MAELAREHFKKNAQGLIGFQSEEDKQPKREQRVRLEVQHTEELEESLSYPEVVRALKRMKRGKGVGIDKVTSEMFIGWGRNAVA